MLGTAGIGGLWGTVDETESVNTLLYALRNGVRVFDTSPSYYNAQEYIGKALQEWDGQKPFISTKVGRLKAEKPDEVYVDYTLEGIRRSVENSLELLGVDYIDLLFLHEPQLVPVDRIDEILDLLHSFQQERLVGKLGIGGNPTDSFWPYVKKENFDVVSTFLKLDACTLEGLEKDIPKYQEEGLAVYAASSLHMGLLGNQFEEYVENPPESDWIQQYHIENAIKVEQIAQKYNVSLPEIALRYLLSIEEADRVVLGPSNLDELKESLSAWKMGRLPEHIFEEITESIIETIA